jgi:hypothetical protein
MKKKKSLLFVLIILLPGIIFTFSACSKGSIPVKQTIRIAIPYDEKIEDIETNYYKWNFNKEV